MRGQIVLVSSSGYFFAQMEEYEDPVYFHMKELCGKDDWRFISHRPACMEPQEGEWVIAKKIIRGREENRGYRAARWTYENWALHVRPDKQQR